MIAKFKIIFFVLSIVVVATFFRFYNLSSVPPSASLDEASIGWNAYSILKTGGDEYGNKFPILLRAYDDWRPALYVYLVIPFVKIFGLNALSVRLPSVILSVIAVFATYFLVKEIFKKKSLALLSSLLLAISPWHIYISRLGHEVNAGLSFSVFAILFFLKAMNGRKFLLLNLSAIFFALSLYTYQSEKIFVPLIILVLVFAYKKKLLKMKKALLASLIVGIIIIIPIILATLSPQALIRFKGTSAFSNESFYKESADKILQYKKEGNFFGEIINNRRLVPLKIFSTNYLSHFHPSFLFLNSGNESFKAPNIGLLYVWEIPFLIVGLIFLLKKIDIKTRILLSFWLLISFVAPSLTTNAPHAMRAFNVLPVPQIITALGIITANIFIKKRQIKIIFCVLMAILAIYSSIFFYKEYFYAFPKNQSSSFQYSLSNAIRFVIGMEKSYNTIIFSNKDNLYQSYMFYLFYSKYDPYSYQKEGGTGSGGFDETHQFGKFKFQQIDFKKENLGDKTLYIINPSENINNNNIIRRFKELNGRESMLIVQK
ncbi:MAG: glycosyltransferase family 39 protein [Candidatus Levybacteria bacterium]|nr:glycosyltransferase family 39 protein [Candidatus Levybacteria bacterium]